MEITQLHAFDGTADHLLCNGHDPRDFRRDNIAVGVAGMGLYRFARDPQHLAGNGQHRGNTLRIFPAVEPVPDDTGSASAAGDDLKMFEIFLRGELI